MEGCPCWGTPPTLGQLSSRPCEATNERYLTARSARGLARRPGPATVAPVAGQTSSCRRGTASSLPRRAHSRGCRPCGDTPGRRRAPTPSTRCAARPWWRRGAARCSGWCGASSPPSTTATSSSSPTTSSRTRRPPRTTPTASDATTKSGLPNTRCSRSYPRTCLNSSTGSPMCTLYS